MNAIDLRREALVATVDTLARFLVDLSPVMDAPGYACPNIPVPGYPAITISGRTFPGPHGKVLRYVHVDAPYEWLIEALRREHPARLELWTCATRSITFVLE